MLTRNSRLTQFGIALAAVVGIGIVGSASTAKADHYDARYGVSIDFGARADLAFDTDGDGSFCDSERTALVDHYWNMSDDDRFYQRRARRFRQRASNELSFRFVSTARRFVKFDHNRDGVLTMREVRGSSLGDHFYTIDRTSDGILTPAEIDRFYLKMGKRSESTYSPGVLRGANYRYEYRLDYVN